MIDHCAVKGGEPVSKYGGGGGGLEWGGVLISEHGIIMGSLNVFQKQQCLVTHIRTNDQAGLLVL